MSNICVTELLLSGYSVFSQCFLVEFKCRGAYNNSTLLKTVEVETKFENE